MWLWRKRLLQRRWRLWKLWAVWYTRRYFFPIRNWIYFCFINSCIDPFHKELSQTSRHTYLQHAQAVSRVAILAITVIDNGTQATRKYRINKYSKFTNYLCHSRIRPKCPNYAMRVCPCVILFKYLVFAYQNLTSTICAVSHGLDQQNMWPVVYF